MYDHSLPCLQITRSDHQATLKEGYQTGDFQATTLFLLRVCVAMYMCYYTHFITLYETMDNTEGAY